MNERIYMGQQYVRPGCGAYFVNEERNICRQIIDPRGNFRVFPGIAPDERLAQEYPTFKGAPVLRKEIRFGKCCDDRILAVWTVRSDGLEEMDHFGFGGEDWESLGKRIEYPINITTGQPIWVALLKFERKGLYRRKML